MKRLMAMGAFCLCAAALSAAAGPQLQKERERATPDDPATQVSPGTQRGESRHERGAMADVHLVRQLLDATFNATGGKKVGHVADIVMSPTGELHYAIVEMGSRLGIGGTRHAIPWQKLKLDYKQKSFAIDMSPELLKQAPAFKSDAYEELDDASWHGKVAEFFKVSAPISRKPESDAVEPPAEGAKSELTQQPKTESSKFLRARSMIAARVNGTDGSEIARIRDLVMAGPAPATLGPSEFSRPKGEQPSQPTLPGKLEGGAAERESAVQTEFKGGAAANMNQFTRISYVIVGCGGTLGVGQIHVAVPWVAFNCTPKGPDITAVLNISKQQLEKAPVLQKVGYRDLLDAQFVSNNAKYFGVTGERKEIETEAPGKAAKPESGQPQPEGQRPRPKREGSSRRGI